MSSIKITHDNKLGLFLSKVTREQKIGVRKGVLQSAYFAAREIVGSARSTMGSRTGGLWRSFLRGVTFVGGSDSLTAGAYSDSVYAGIQNDGGTIRPKNTRALAIPISEKAKRTVGLWPRNWPKDKLFVFKSDKGNTFLAEQSGKKGLILHYVLKKAARITPKHYIENAAKNAAPGIAEIIDSAIYQAFKRSVV